MKNEMTHAHSAVAGGGHKTLDNRMVAAGFFLMIVLFNIVDIITAVQLIREDDFTAGQIFKGMIFALLFVFNLRHATFKKNIYLLYLLFYYMVVVEAANFIIYQYDIQFFLRGMTFITKVLMPFMFYYYFLSLARKGYLHYETFRKGFYLYVLLFSVNIISPIIAGISRSTYGRSGFTGFYYAGNELGTFLTIVFPVLLYFYLRETKRNVFILFILILLVISGVMEGTKTPLIATMLSMAMVPVLLMRTRKLWLIALPLFMIGAYIMIIMYGRVLLDYLPKNIYGRLIWTASQREGIVELLLGVRAEYFIQYLENIASKGIWAILFGNGFMYSARFMYLHLGIYKAAEMDGIDILARYGVVGLVFACVMVILVIRNNYQKQSNYSIIVTYMFLLLTVNSFLAGHVFGNAFSAMMLGMVFTMNRMHLNQGQDWRVP